MHNLYSQFKKVSLAVQLLAVGWLAIMILLPFHALISTWGGTTIGPLEAWKSWKEVLLALMVVGALMQMLRDRQMAATLWGSRINKLIVVFGGWLVVVSLLVGNQLKPLVVGLSIDLRFFTFLLVSQVIFYYLRPTVRQVAAVPLVPACGVVVFGLLQKYVLPYDFLAWFGYRANVTIAPYNTIDQQLSQLRIMSTLRGPNPLGAYLILPLITLFGMTVHFLRQYHRSSNRQSLVLLIGSGLGFVLSLVVLYGSQSRSAWLGFVVALGLFVLLLAPLKIQKILIALGVAGVIVASFGVYQLRDTSFVQNVILHDNPNIGPKETSNSGHSEALRQALGDIKDRPILGCGPGCAGPASFYDPDGARLAENNFLQIAQETGVIGLALFIVTTILIGVELLRRRDDAVALMFFASLVGLSVANLLLHVWSDDTLAYVWWGALGYVLATRLPAGAVLKSKQ